MPPKPATVIDWSTIAVYGEPLRASTPGRETVPAAARDAAVEPQASGRPAPDSADSRSAGSPATAPHPGIDQRDWDDVIDTMLGEAGGEGPDGMAAVAHTIVNRAGRRGQSIGDVVRAPKQFEGYETPGAGSKRNQQDPALRSSAEDILRKVFAGELSDPTGGADHFHSGPHAPGWAAKMNPTAQIGGHRFYDSAARRGADAEGRVAEPTPADGPVPQPRPGRGGDPEGKGFARLASAGGGNPGEEVVPAADFLATRLVGHGKEHVTGMQAPMQDRLTALFMSAPTDIAKKLGIFSGARSVERQKQLWAQAVKKYGSAEKARRWVAPPGRSMHNSGRAADLAYNGKSLRHAPQNVLDWVHENAGRFGLHFPLGHEPWHVEMVEARGGTAPDDIDAVVTSATGRGAAAGEKPARKGAAAIDWDTIAVFGERPPASTPREGPVPTPRPEDAPDAPAAPDPVEEEFARLEAEQPGVWQIIDDRDYEKHRAQWEAAQPGFLEDLVRLFGGSAVEGVGHSVQGLSGLGGTVDEAVDTIFGTDNPGRVAAGAIKDTGARIKGGVSHATRQAIEGSTPGGDLLSPSTWTLGKNPSLRGYTALALDVMGSLVPVVAASVLAGPVGGMAVGAAQGGGAAEDEAHKLIDAMADNGVLEKESAYYREQIAAGKSPDEAVAATRQAAGQVAFLFTAPISGLGGAATGKLVDPATHILAGKNIVARIAGRAGLSAVEEGAQEAAESVATRHGVNVGAGTDLDTTEGTFGDFVLGVLGGSAAGAAGGALSRREPAHGTEADGADVAPQAQDLMAAPGTPPEAAPDPQPRKGPLRRAVDYGAERAPQASEFIVQEPAMGDMPAGEMDGQRVRLAPDQAGVPEGMRRVVGADGQERLIGDRILAPAAPELETRPGPSDGPLPARPSDARPSVGATVRADIEGSDPVMGRIESFDGDEAVVFDSATGEVYQVPIGELTVLHQYPSEEEAQAAHPPAEPIAAETRAELPPASQDMPALERFPGPPEPGQRVIVSADGVERFAGRIVSYEDGATEALVTRDDGVELQVPVDNLYVNRLTRREAEAEELTRNPPVERERAAGPTVRDVFAKQVDLPDDRHARLFDLGRLRRDSQKTLGASTLDRDIVDATGQRALADEFGVSTQALGQIADDYRYRVERAAKEARSRLAVKMHPVNDRLLKRVQAEHRRVQPESVVPDTDAAWWDGELTAPERKAVLERAGVKRSEKMRWGTFTKAIREKIIAARNAASEAVALLDEAANEAATSPTNTLPEPTAAQKEANNYRLGHIRLAGMDISIENPAGSTRSGTDRHGKPWSVEMPGHYGYIKRTEGADGDHLDVYVKPGTQSLGDGSRVYAVNQVDVRTRQFDEVKVILGADSLVDALSLYMRGFSDNLGRQRIGSVAEFSLPGFQDFLSNGGGKAKITRAERTARIVPPSALPDVAEPSGPVPQSQQSQLSQLRRARDRPASRTDELPGLLDGGRAATVVETPAGPSKERGGLQAGQPPVGHKAGTGEQSQEKQASQDRRGNQNLSRVGAASRAGPVDNPLSAAEGDVIRGGGEDATARTGPLERSARRREESANSRADNRRAQRLDKGVGARGGLEPFDTSPASRPGLVTERGDQPTAAATPQGTIAPRHPKPDAGRKTAARPKAPPASAQEFIRSPEGRLDFGMITPEIADVIKRQAAPIRLQAGDAKFGLAHIEARHGDDIRAAGYPSVPAFVSEIASSIAEIWKPAGGSQLVAVRPAGNDRVMFIQLQPGRDDGGDFYTVNTAFPARAGFVRNKGWQKLWEGRAQPSTPASSEQAPFAAPSRKAGEADTIPSGQSRQTITPASADVQSPALSGTTAPREGLPAETPAAPDDDPRAGVARGALRAAEAKGRKPTGQQRTARGILGADVGDIIVASADIDYSEGGHPYRIEAIGRSGAVRVVDPDTGAGTTWSLGDLLRARKLGVTFETRRAGPDSRPQDEGAVTAPTDASPSLPPEPVARLAGDELGMTYGGPQDMPALRRAAERWYDANLRGTTATMADGTTVGFNQRGRKKSVSGKGDVILRAVPAIRAIIEQGRVVLREPGDRAHVVERIVVSATVEIAGAVRPLAVTLHRTADGHLHYDLHTDTGAGDPGIGARLAGREFSADSNEGIASTLNLFEWQPESNTEGRIAEVGQDLAGLGEADRRAIRDIIRDVAGLDEVTFVERIALPDGAPGWGSIVPTTAAGFYDPAADAITIATASTGSGRVAFHEAFHRLQRLFMDDAERAVLKAETGRLRRIVSSDPARRGQVAGMSQSELEAEAFAIWAEARGETRIRPHRAIRAVWERIVETTRRVRNFLAGRGFATAEDVFAAAAGGAMRTRKPGTMQGSNARSYSIAGARAADEVRGRLTDIQPHLLALVPLNYFTELARPNMTAVGDYLLVKRKMDAYRNKKHAAMDEIAQQWRRYARLGWGPAGRSGKAKAAELAELMHAATLAGIDPSKTDAETQAMPGYADLRRRFQAMPRAGRELFATVRDAYKEQAAELDRILIDNVRKAQEIARNRAEAEYREKVAEINAQKTSPQARKQALEEAERAYKGAATRAQWSMKARLTQLRKAFEASRVEEPYFPLARFGRYFVAVRDGDKVLSFSRRERAADRDRLARELAQANPGAKIETGVMDEAKEVRDAMDPRIIRDIEKIVGGAGLDANTMTSVLDQIWQRYLATMPDLSTRKRFIHRKGTAGFDADALRAYASHMFHAAHQMARLKHGMDLTETLNKAADQARAADDPTRGTTLANELRKRHDWIMNPQGAKWTQSLNSMAFIWMLAATPAAAIVNVTQTPMIAFPVLGARLGGMGKAAAALTRASSDLLLGRGTSRLATDEQRAMDAFYESGLIDRTMAHDLAGVGETGVEYSPLRARVMAVISWMYHNAEVVNRRVTGLAAYRMARALGQDEAQAIATAHDAVWASHFDYTNSSRARFLQRDWAKAAFVFQSHTLNLTYRVLRDTHQALRGETAQARKEARYQLAGIMGMMQLMAGGTGVFAYSSLMALLEAFFGDDDDPFDFDTHVRRAVLEALGPDAGGMVLDGVPGHLLGIELTERIGMPYLWLRPENRDLEGRAAFDNFLLRAAGASAGMIGNMVHGAHVALSGDLARGVEVAAPKFIKDYLKGFRYLNEGVVSLAGHEVLPPDAIEPWEAIVQAIGFTPAKVSETYARNSIARAAEQRITARRRKLVDAFISTRSAGDAAARQRAIDEIRRFNAVPLYRSVAITEDTIRRSMASRARNNRLRQDGLLISNEELGAAIRDKLPQRVHR